MRIRPKVLQDIGPKSGRAYSSLKARVDLSRKTSPMPFLDIVRSCAIVLSVIWFMFGNVTSAPTALTYAAVSDEEERVVLEEQLKELEGQINQYENQITGYRKQGRSLNNEISALNSKISKLNLQIQAINLTFRELDRKIGDTQFQIKSTEASLEDRREALTALMRSLYATERESLLSVFLKNPRLSDFFSDLNGVLLLQNNMRLAIEQITDLRDQLAEERDQLVVARADAKTVGVYRESQKKEVNSTKAEKNRLLTLTKGQESKFQTLLIETKQTAAKIRSRIFQLLGGGEMSFEDAYKYAQLASGATGVRPALILAVLDKESALGQNVGRCSYKTAMSPSNREIFLKIVEEIGLNPNSLVVSCPNRDGAYGGAMGPAQFIPTTWNMYKDQVAKVTGHNPPSPWNNSDAFVATAIYLKDAGAASDSISAQRIAAARYYAGGNWRRYLWTYGEGVISKAQRFEQDIEAISE